MPHSAGDIQAQGKVLEVKEGNIYSGGKLIHIQSHTLNVRRIASKGRIILDGGYQSEVAEVDNIRLCVKGYHSRCGSII
jgi:hypothetical protein